MAAHGLVVGPSIREAASADQDGRQPELPGPPSFRGGLLTSRAPLTLDVAPDVAATSSASAAARLAKALTEEVQDLEEPRQVQDDAEAPHKESASQYWAAMVAESAAFGHFYMLLTLLSLFAPDFDQLLGTKESAVVLAWCSTFVFILFLVELLVKWAAYPKFRCSGYFWLDAVAALSLLPETHLIKDLVVSSNIVNGDTAGLLRTLRVAARSSKAMRLTRLTRLTRVVSCLPRVAALLKRKDKRGDEARLMTKKLQRLFNYLDEDLDDRVGISEIANFIAIMKTAKALQNLPEQGETPVGDASDSHLFATGEAGGRHRGEAGEPAPNTARSGDASDSQLVTTGGAEGAAEDAVRPAPNLAQSGTKSSSTAKVRRHSGKSTLSLASAATAGMRSEELDFDGFCTVVLGDRFMRNLLYRLCRDQIMSSANAEKLTSKHTEATGIRVAMGVLGLLLVLNLVGQSLTDQTNAAGLEHMDALMSEYYPDMTATDPIPVVVHDMVQRWMDGVGDESGTLVYRIKPQTKILYLDLGKKVYCNELISDGRFCSDAVEDTNETWFRLRSDTENTVEDVEQELQDSKYRFGVDLAILILPEPEGSLSSDEMNSETRSLVVFDVRQNAENRAIVTLLTTVLIIIMILSGIHCLTKDLTKFSIMVLKPLKELTAEMQTIQHLQMAGCGREDQDAQQGGTSEIKHIRSTFDKMKLAIKSWGKYVPWPVVQQLLTSGVGAKPEVTYMEVTMFFSDIAGFTTIVEGLEPERSLVLLTRYFNDMSTVIDAEGGIVIEFIGDAILAVYGAPAKLESHAGSGVRATLKMLAALKKINAWAVSQNLPEIGLRCGVHTGLVLIGNMGFQQRIKYGIVGEESQIPAHLEEMNKHYGTNMLASGTTVGKLDKNEFIMRPVDFIHLRSDKEQNPPEYVYEVVERKHDNRKAEHLEQVCSMHTDAMNAYLARDFVTAEQLFQRVGTLMPAHKGGDADKPAALMSKRCQFYIASPPPDSWNGVWDQRGEP